jgi:hypothetical protein
MAAVSILRIPCTALSRALRRWRGGGSWALSVLPYQKMADAAIGPLLVASLHQAVAEVLPDRLDFYETWLNPNWIRKRRIGPAAVGAALSFLRREDDYDKVVERAGEYAVDWTFDSLSPVRHGIIRLLPVWLRRRAATRLAASVVLESTPGPIQVQTTPAESRLTLKSSFFCTVREPARTPLCGYYAAALKQVFVKSGLSGSVKIKSCKGTGDAECRLVLSFATASEAESDP